MNIGVIRERNPFDRRVALTPPVVRRLAGAGHSVWVETGSGDGAMFRDTEYIRAGGQIAYSPAEVLQRAELVVKIARPTVDEIRLCRPGTALMAFYHMAVADKELLDALAERSVTAIGSEIVQLENGRLPVLAAVSEVAGQMTTLIAAHLLRSSSGGRGILLGGTPGVPPARVVILGAGAVGTAAARSAVAAGARVLAFDIQPNRLRRIMEHARGVATCIADEEAIAEAVAAADVVIGAVLVAGTRTPHVVTRGMVETMKAGSALIDVSIDQGGCAETSRLTSLADPTFVYKGVTHFCVPNITADLGRASSVAIAQATLPYLLELAARGIDAAIGECSDLRRGLYLLRGRRP
ncbi:MAG TPA: NAD(P)-binding domain-containing protein [Bryobacteraceae bacterium]|nr:NAD(P)-binding domain-containing protein [Bryobacteraceae bacterium]